MPVRIYLSDLEKLGATFTPKETKRKMLWKIFVSGTLTIGDRVYDVIFYKRRDGSQTLYDVKDVNGKFEVRVMEDFMNTLNRSGLERLKDSFARRNKYTMMINMLLVFSAFVIMRGFELYVTYQMDPKMLVFVAGGIVIAILLVIAKSKVWKQ